MSNPAFGTQIPGSLVVAQGGDRPELYNSTNRKARVDVALASDEDAEALRQAQLSESTDRMLSRRPELQAEIVQLGATVLDQSVSVE